MIFSCGETWDARRERLRKYHRWFAWHPVKIRVEDGKHVCAWLQYVERSVDFYADWGHCGWVRVYRELP